MNYCLNFREKGLSGVCDLIEETMAARIDQLEVENSDLVDEKADLRRSQLEKIPKCPVNITLHFDSNSHAFFPRCVLISSRRISRSTAALPAIISVEPAWLPRGSRYEMKFQTNNVLVSIFRFVRSAEAPSMKTAELMTSRSLWLISRDE